MKSYIFTRKQGDVTFLAASSRYVKIPILQVIQRSLYKINFCSLVVLHEIHLRFTLVLEFRSTTFYLDGSRSKLLCDEIR